MHNSRTTLVPQRTLAVVFTLMSIVLFPTMWIAASGSRISSADMDAFGFARLSVGNIGPSPDAGCKCVIDACQLTVYSYEILRTGTMF